MSPMLPPWRSMSSSEKRPQPHALTDGASMRPALSFALAPILAIAALLCLLQPAMAQATDAEWAKQWFLQHDRNHDGYITLDEVMGYEEKLFKRMDQEGAGRLREDQYC